MEGFLQVGLEMDLKGLIGVDWRENLGEEEQEGLFFQIEEKIPTERRCVMCWDGQNRGSGWKLAIGWTRCRGASLQEFLKAAIR